MKRHDLATVADILRPRIVLSCSTPAYDSLEDAGRLGTFANVCVHQRRQTMIRKSIFAETVIDPGAGIKVKEWTQALPAAHGA